MQNNVQQNLKSHNITLPAPFNPKVAKLLTARIHNGILRVSGQTPRVNGELHYIGKVGRDFDLKQGQDAARISALNVIAQAKRALEGDLDRVEAVLNVRGFVNADPEFSLITETVNGASDLFLDVFGDHVGMHTRTAIGVAVMPYNVAIEVEAEFAVR